MRFLEKATGREFSEGQVFTAWESEGRTGVFREWRERWFEPIKEEKETLVTRLQKMLDESILKSAVEQMKEEATPNRAGYVIDLPNTIRFSDGLKITEVGSGLFRLDPVEPVKEEKEPHVTCQACLKSRPSGAKLEHVWMGEEGKSYRECARCHLAATAEELAQGIDLGSCEVPLRRRSEVWVSKNNPDFYGSWESLRLEWTQERYIAERTTLCFRDWAEANYVLKVVEWVE